MTGPRRTGIENLRRALIASKGNMSAAARALGLDRATVWRKIRDNPELQALLADILEESGDDLEQKLKDLGMGQNNVTAVLALLNARHRDRGYGYANRTDVVVSGHVTHGFHLHDVGNQAMKRLAAVDDDKLLEMIERRRAGLDAEPEPRGRMIDVTPRRLAADLPEADDGEPSDGQG